MKRLLAIILSVAMLTSIVTAVQAGNTDGNTQLSGVMVQETPTPNATVDTSATVDPNATATPFRISCDFESDTPGELGAGWTGNAGGGHKVIDEVGFGGGKALACDFGTNGLNSGYYVIGDLVAGNIYKVTAKVKLGITGMGGRLLVTVLKCQKSADAWTYKAIPEMTVFDSTQMVSIPGDDGYMDVNFEFMATEMEEGYATVNKQEFPAWKFDFLYMGAKNTTFFVDNIVFEDVTATSTFAPPTVAPTAVATAVATPVATATPTTTPVITPSEEPTKAPTKVTIKINKKKATIKKGKKLTLKVTVKGTKKKPTFSSSKKKIAKITKKTAKSVTIKGLKKGKATITAKVAKKSAKCSVTVK